MLASISRAAWVKIILYRIGDEVFRVLVELSFFGISCVDVQCFAVEISSLFVFRQAHFIFDRALVISHLQLGIINAVEFPQHAEKIGLTFE